MKKTIFTLLTFVSLTTYGQNATSSQLNERRGKHEFTCQRIEMTPDTKKFFMKENVKIETGNLSIEADSVVFDKENQTLVAYGTKEFTFRGGQAIISEKPKYIIRYTLNDKTIYIE